MIIGHERRRSPRFEASYRLELEGFEGVTRNLSGTGLLFETGHEVSEGSLVRLHLHVMPREGGTMIVAARVVRVRRRGDVFDVAARIERVSVQAETPSQEREHAGGERPVHSAL